MKAVDYNCTNCGHVGEYFVDSYTTPDSCRNCGQSGGLEKLSVHGFNIGSGSKMLKAMGSEVVGHVQAYCPVHGYQVIPVIKKVDPSRN